MVNQVFEIMEARKAKTNYAVYISCIEFYMAACLDILNDKSPIEVDVFKGPQGQSLHKLNSISDLWGVLETVSKMRAATGTKMNV